MANCDPMTVARAFIRRRFALGDDTRCVVPTRHEIAFDLKRAGIAFQLKFALRKLAMAACLGMSSMTAAA